MLPFYCANSLYIRAYDVLCRLFRFGRNSRFSISIKKFVTTQESSLVMQLIWSSLITLALASLIGIALFSPRVGRSYRSHTPSVCVSVSKKPLEITSHIVRTLVEHSVC